MIERHWKGVVKRGRADDYVGHLQNETFKQTATIDGFVSAKIMKREVEGEVEFLIVTEWNSLDAIKKFAGADIEKAVVPKFVQDIMTRYDDAVRHYEVYWKTKTA